MVKIAIGSSPSPLDYSQAESMPQDLKEELPSHVHSFIGKALATIAFFLKSSKSTLLNNSTISVQIWVTLSLASCESNKIQGSKLVPPSPVVMKLNSNYKEKLLTGRSSHH